MGFLVLHHPLPAGNFRSPYLGKVHSSRKSSATHAYQRVQCFCVQTMLWLPVFGTWNVSADFGGCDCTRRLHGCRKNKRVCTELVEVLLYVHRNRRLIRDGSPGRPPRLSHSSWALSTELLGVQPYLFSPCQWRAEKLVGSWRIWYFCHTCQDLFMTSLTHATFITKWHLSFTLSLTVVFSRLSKVDFVLC